MIRLWAIYFAAAIGILAGLVLVVVEHEHRARRRMLFRWDEGQAHG